MALITTSVQLVPLASLLAELEEDTHNHKKFAEFLYQRWGGGLFDLCCVQAIRILADLQPYILTFESKVPGPYSSLYSYLVLLEDRIPGIYIDLTG